MARDPRVKSPTKICRAGFLRLLLGCFFLCSFRTHAADVTSHVELLGNPFLARYSASVNSRNVNRMRAFNNRVYLGNGSTGAQVPADLWYFDLAQDSFIKEAAIFEETTDQIRVFGDRMYIPGRDSMGQGNLYRWDSTNLWQTLPVGADGHYMDVFEQSGKVFVHAAILALPYPRIAISTDQAATFSVPGQTIDGVNFDWFSGSHWQFFEFKGVLYSTILRSTATDPNYPPTPSHPPFLVKYTGVDTAPIARVHQHYTDFCPPGEFWVVTDFVELGDYGVFNGGGNLYRVSDVEASTPATRIDLPFQGPADGVIGMGLVTILKSDNALYTCSNISSNGLWQIAVCKSLDATTWDQQFHFMSSNHVRSFERTPTGDFLFSSRTNNSPEMGNILRVRAEAIAGASLPLVNLSADQTTTWEGSGNPLNLRIRRAGATNDPVTVHYAVSGTAVADVDYTALSGTATIPAGAHSTEVTIAIIETPANTGARTLTVSLTPDAAYTIAAPSEIDFTITDETAGGTGLPKPGLALWLRADLGVTLASGVVSEWADQSGNGLVATQSSSAKRPTPLASDLGGHAALLFDGGDALDIGSIRGQVYYAAVVFTNRLAVTTSTAQTLLNFMGYAEGGSTGLDLGSAQTQFADETISIYQQAWRADTLAAGAHKLVLAQAQHAASYTLHIDGADKGMTSQNANKNITLTGDSVRIGSRNGSNRYFDGVISEVIIYNRPLSAAEQTAIDTYLSARYFTANQDPSTAPDTITRAAGEPVTFAADTLLANDTDANNDTLTVTEVGSPQPAGASVILDSGMITYTPAPGQDEAGSFTYTVSDGNGGIVTETVTVLTSATVDLTDLAHTYDGSGKSATATTTPPGLSVTITYNGSAASPTTAGSYAVEAIVTDPNYSGMASATLVIAQATLTVTADDKNKIAGAANPTLTATISGFVGGEDLATSGVTGDPALSTTATISSPGGDYPITPVIGTLEAGNYTFAMEAGTLTVLNNNPVAVLDGLGCEQNSSAKVQIAKLLANDTDADGHTITFTSVAATSLNGGEVTVDNGWVLYTAPEGFSSDQITYTISDGFGGAANGTISVSLHAGDDEPSLNFISATPDGDDMILLFAGIPGEEYSVEWTADLTSPITWTLLGTATAGSNGRIEFRVVGGAAFTMRYYRTTEP